MAKVGRLFFGNIGSHAFASGAADYQVVKGLCNIVKYGSLLGFGDSAVVTICLRCVAAVATAGGEEKCNGSYRYCHSGGAQPR